MRLLNSYLCLSKGAFRQNKEENIISVKYCLSSIAQATKHIFYINTHKVRNIEQGGIRKRYTKGYDIIGEKYCDVQIYSHTTMRPIDRLQYSIQLISDIVCLATLFTVEIDDYQFYFLLDEYCERKYPDTY